MIDIGISFFTTHRTFAYTHSQEHITARLYPDVLSLPLLTYLVAAEIHPCAKCKKPIYGEYILINGQRMHPEHYTCHTCGKEFKGGDCNEFMGKLYCKDDYQKLLKGVCNACRKPIVGRSITAMGRVWHPEHFVCAHCHRPFMTSTFREHDGKPYCEMHYKQLFADICAKCNRPVVDKIIRVFGKAWHPEHFVCAGCETTLGSKFHRWDDKPLCTKCYTKLPSAVRKKIRKQFKGEKQKQDVRDLEQLEEIHKKQSVAMQKAAQREAKKQAEREALQKRAADKAAARKAAKEKAEAEKRTRRR